MIRHFIVEIDMPKEVSVRRMQEYILTSVRDQMGLYHPIDPITEVPRKTIRCLRPNEILRKDMR